jgi:hypothetical protein
MTAITPTAETTTVARTSRGTLWGTLAILAGIVFALAGAGTWAAVQTNLAQEKITVAGDAPYFAGQTVDGPLTAFVQAEVINTHYLDSTGGRTYAELDRDDPLRDVAMNASFLRASLFTSVVSFGVALMAMGLGATLTLAGIGIRANAKA